MSFREENVRYLRPLWIRAGLVYAAVLAVLIFSFLNWPGTLAQAWPIVVGVTVGVGLVVFRRGKRKALGRQSLQHSSADAAARLLFGQYINTPGKAVVPLVVTGTSQLHVIYGNFARVEEMLAKVDWEKEPPLIRGDRLFVLALLEHVKGNHDAGVRITETMVPLMDVPKVFPGSARMRRSIALIEDIGRVLAGDDREAAVRLADPKLTRSSRLQRGLAAWALSEAFRRWGDAEAAHRWSTESRAILPHAYGLGVPRPAAASATPSAPLDPQNPYAAPSVAAIDAAPFEARPGPPTFWRRHRYKVVGVWLLVLVAAHTYLSCYGRQS